MFEVININFNHILTLIETMALPYMRALLKESFAIITSMISILKLCKNPKTRKEVVRGVLILIGHVITHHYT